MSLFGGFRSRQKNGGQNQTMPACTVCPGQHGLWRCDKFKKQSHQDRWKVVHEQILCIKCLQSGHFARNCPKTQFKCQVDGYKKEHNTLLHPPPADSTSPSVNRRQLNQEEARANTNSETSGVTGEGAAVTASTGASERVCLSVVPVKVLTPLA